MNLLSIFLITFNEERLLPYTVAYYRERFPGCPITIYDNFSTDRTVEIAKALDCEVKYFYTANKLSDQAFISVKNNCWKGASTPWVIVCDTDEWLDVWPSDLETNATIFHSDTAQMVGTNDEFNPLEITTGVFYPWGKMLCFNRNAIEEINYNYGCHEALPQGDVIFSDKILTMYHYKWITLKYIIDRHAMFGKRLSPHNRKNKLSFHYLFSERKIRSEYKALVKKSVKIK